MVSPGTPNEASTRAALIDTQLARAGWSKSRRNLVEEVVLVATEPTSSWDQGNCQGRALAPEAASTGPT